MSNEISPQLASLLLEYYNTTEAREEVRSEIENLLDDTEPSKYTERTEVSTMIPGSFRAEQIKKRVEDQRRELLPIERAELLLHNLTLDGPIPTADMYAAAGKAGITVTTLKRAKTIGGYHSYRAYGTWYVSKPDGI